MSMIVACSMSMCVVFRTMWLRRGVEIVLVRYKSIKTTTNVVRDEDGPSRRC